MLKISGGISAASPCRRGAEASAKVGASTAFVPRIGHKPLRLNTTILNGRANEFSPHESRVVAFAAPELIQSRDAPVLEILPHELQIQAFLALNVAVSGGQPRYRFFFGLV